MRIRRNLVSLVGVALVAAGCGGATDESGADVVVLDSVGDGASELDDPAPGNASPVALALESTAAATAYHAELAMGIEMSFGGEEFGIELEADPASPMMLVDVDADGEQHTLVDMGSMMGSMLEASGLSAADVEAMFGDMTMETWLAGDVMTIDIGGFADLLQAEPGAAMIFPGEVFTVDTARLGEGIGGPELASAMTGQIAPDPATMAAVLGELLGGAVADDGSFSGTIGFLDYARAFGQDPEAMLGGDMGAMFESIGGDETVEAMLDIYRDIDVDVSGTIADGAIDTLRFDVDMSSIWTDLPELLAATGESIPAAELTEFEAMADGATFSMTMLLDVDLDPSIDVVVPEGDFVDATDQWLDVFGFVLG